MSKPQLADLADLLRCLSAWFDAEEQRLQPLLDRHNVDIDGLRITLDRYAALLTPEPDEVDF